jgi:hypothetical protein
VVDALQRRGTFYGLTNQRVIIVRGLLHREVKSTFLRTVSDLSLVVRRDGSGTIRFGNADMAWYAAGQELWWPGAGAGTSLIRIPNAREVYDRIRAAQCDAA